MRAEENVPARDDEQRVADVHSDEVFARIRERDADIVVMLTAVDSRLTAFFSAVSKLEVFQSEFPPSELEASDEYADFEELVDTFREINRDSA